MTEPQSVHGSIKAVAGYEIVKGVGALITAFSLWRWHQELFDIVNNANNVWVKSFGDFLAPQIDSLVRIAQRAAHNWQLFMVGIVGYALLRFVEAYGLWKHKTWAYWFSILGYGLFIPAEVYYLIVRPFDWFKLVILLLNLTVVYVVYKHMRRKKLI